MSEKKWSRQSILIIVEGLPVGNFKCDLTRSEGDRGEIQLDRSDRAGSLGLDSSRRSRTTPWTPWGKSIRNDFNNWSEFSVLLPASHYGGQVGQGNSFSRGNSSTGGISPKFFSYPSSRKFSWEYLSGSVKLWLIFLLLTFGSRKKFPRALKSYLFPLCWVGTLCIGLRFSLRKGFVKTRTREWRNRAESFREQTLGPRWINVSGKGRELYDTSRRSVTFSGTGRPSLIFLMGTSTPFNHFVLCTYWVSYFSHPFGLVAFSIYFIIFYFPHQFIFLPPFFFLSPSPTSSTNSHFSYFL